MIDEAKFEELISMQESMLLDFKKEMYNLSNEDKTADLVKDIISMINTKRASTSYIIIGIDAQSNGENVLVGINSHFDEAIIQEKIKNKITPTPIFEYYVKEHNQLKFSVFEFPVNQYKSFLSSPIKLKGIEPSVPYYRLGSTNQEAKGHKVIEINDWITSVGKPMQESFTKEDWLMDILHRLNDNEEPLSRIILETYEFALQYKIEPLLDFCSTEIKGVSDYSEQEKYRFINVNYCYGKFSPIKKEPQRIWESRLLNTNNYFVHPHILKFSISEIETYVKEIIETDAIFVLDTTVEYLVPHAIVEQKQKKISIIVHLSVFKEVQINIKAQLHRILMSLY